MIPTVSEKQFVLSINILRSHRLRAHLETGKFHQQSTASRTRPIGRALTYCSVKALPGASSEGALSDAPFVLAAGRLRRE